MKKLQIKHVLLVLISLFHITFTNNIVKIPKNINETESNIGLILFSIIMACCIVLFVIIVSYCVYQIS